MKRCVFVALIFAICLGSVSAQDAVEPAPYEPEEFPQWARDLRRGEIVALGVFPIAYLATTIVYDLFRFGRESFASGSVAVEYAPLFFAPPDAPGYSKEERRGVLIASLSLSTAVAVADYILGRLDDSARDEPR